MISNGASRGAGWIAVLALAVVALAACSSTQVTEPPVVPAAGVACAVPANGSARIRAARPRAGLTCTRYPFPLAAPRDVVEARDGSIYVTEMAAGRIVRLTPEGFREVATGLLAPIGLREGAAGELYVAEEGGQRVTRVDPATGEKRLVADALGNVTYLAMGPDGAVYVSSFTSFAPTGSVKRIALPVVGGVAEIRDYGRGLDVPEGLVFDPDGRLVVAEWNASPSRVVRLTPSGGAASDAPIVASGLVHAYGVALATTGADGPFAYFVADTAVGADRVVLADGSALVDVLVDVASPAGLLRASNGDLLVVEHGDSDTHAATGYLLRLSGF